MFRIPPRGRHVTAEPQIVAESLLGRNLATFRRRSRAIALDVLIFGLVTGALFFGLTAWSFHREDPTLFARTGRVFGGDGSEAFQDSILADYYFMILERCPDAFPRDIAAVIRARDVDGLREHYRAVSTTIGLGAGTTRTIEQSDGSHRVVIGLDLLMGPFAGVLGWGSLFVGWFTIWTLVTRGRSPAKALLRMRIVRLDGHPLNLWDCFSRSGGYSASAATLFIGFLEAVWHPNRQAIHDRIAGTVVLHT